MGCHFYLLKDGTLHQYLDTDRYSGHAWDANHWAIGMESQDTGVSADPGPWTSAQLDSIDHLAHDLGIPAKALMEGRSEGVGYHRQFDSWNQNHHSCPGDAKVAQMAGIIERLKGDADVNDTQDRILRRVWNDLRNEAVTRGVSDVPPDIDTDDDKAPYKGWVTRLNTKRAEAAAQLSSDIAAVKAKLGA